MHLLQAALAAQNPGAAMAPVPEPPPAVRAMDVVWSVNNPDDRGECSSCSASSMGEPPDTTVHMAFAPDCPSAADGAMTCHVMLVQAWCGAWRAKPIRRPTTRSTRMRRTTFLPATLASPGAAHRACVQVARQHPCMRGGLRSGRSSRSTHNGQKHRQLRVARLQIVVHLLGAIAPA